MSAFPDIPSDLVEWARRTGRQPDAQAFLPRRDYAVYLRETLDRLRDERFAFRAERVLDVVPVAGGFELHAAGGRVTRAATRGAGTRQPAPGAADQSAACRLPEARWHLPDPWDLDRLTALAPDAVVVLVGTGLTAVDAAITLLDDAPGRRVVMVSRHGLLPAAHVEQSSTAWLSPVPDRAGHRRPARRPPARPGRRGPAPGCRLAAGRRRAARTHPGALAAPRPRRAPPVPRRRTPASGRYAATGWPPRSRRGSTATATRPG